MATLEHKKETVLKSVRAYLQAKENNVKEWVASTGTVYFYTSPKGSFCGKRIRVSNHSTKDDSVMVSLRYDLIGDNASSTEIRARIFRTLDNSARKQQSRRVGWLLGSL